MGKISSEEVESQYDLIKMLLAEPEKVERFHKCNKEGYCIYAYITKKTWGRKYYLMNELQMAFIIIVNFTKLVNNNSRKLT